MKKMMAVGKISKLFGRDGRLQVNLYDSFLEKDQEEPLYVIIDTLAVPLFFSHFEKKGKQRAIIEFDDIDTPRRAEELIGHHIYAEQQTEKKEMGEERKKGEVYLDEMIGYQVKLYNIEGGVELLGEGTMVDFMDNEFNPLFELRVEGKEVLIPAADEFIRAVDVNRQIIEMVIPEGLLEL